MKKRYWHWSILIALLLAILGLVYWRKNKLSQPISLTKEAQLALTDPDNQFPLSPRSGEIELYTMQCSFLKINRYLNYDRAPILPGDWKILADIACSYFNVQQELEIIYLPLFIYQAEKEELLLTGVSLQPEDEEVVRQYAEITSLAFYEKMIEDYWGDSIEAGRALTLFVEFPTTELQGNQTHGAGFETLLSTEPPYTKQDLFNFYQTGQSSILPEIDGRHYFWPIIGYTLE